MDGYTFIHQTRRQKYLRKSGGIGVFVKNELYQHVTLLDSSSDYIMWFQVAAAHNNKRNELVFGVVYQPPATSKYLTEEEQELFEVEITSMCISNEHVFLLGDMNARVSNKDDFIDADTFLSEYFDFDEEVLNHFNKTDVLDLDFLSRKRANQDESVNTQGESLLDICKSNNLFILNGRCHKDKGVGKFTFRDTSVIDYAISSYEGLKRVQEFEIIDLDPLFSDGHSLLSLMITQIIAPSPAIATTSKSGRKLWDEEKKELFCHNIDMQTLNAILTDIQLVQAETDDISARTIDLLMDKIASVFTISAKKTFIKKKTNYARTKNDKPWFGNECNKTREEYNSAKTRHNRFPTELNKRTLTQKSKQYKSVMNSYINKHKAKTKIKLRNLHSKKPKDFWKLINSMESKTECADLDIEEFFEYFRTSNIDMDTEASESININTIDNDELLNTPITSQEILKCVKKLKNNKACGNDNIFNEYIKSTSSVMMPIYVNLFNLLFDKGIFPSVWLEGIIRPIYKRTGDITNPENYRPITIVSCFAKLFTSVLNSRLNNFVNYNEILQENQAGFRKGYSTNDQIFTLHALIEILKAKKKKLFCTFIDFRKAFDSVWRSGLWQKLLQSGIDGKLLRIINNMYKGIKSCVSLNGQKTSFFSIYSGLRQGENLSPILFSLFINDMEDYLSQNQCEGVDIEYSDEDVFVFVKLLILLYADDTVIFAEDEEKLQQTLDHFSDYCRTWKLKVNQSKTKVVIFGARTTDRYRFVLDGENLEIADNFKYLGIFFSKSRSFLKARKHVLEQARKALFLLYKRIRHFNLPIDLQLKLFDHTIVPILLYGSEIWGYENVDGIEKFHNAFLRKITNLKKSTPIYMLHAELGRYPLEIKIKMRMINFWLSTISSKPNKLPNIAYKVLLADFNNGVYEHKWIKTIKNILESVGRNDLWLSTDLQNINAIKHGIFQTLLDQNIQKWQSKLDTSSKGLNYKLFKTDIHLENYLIHFSKSVYLPILKFRTTNHKLPVELGRWGKIVYGERKCQKCNSNSVGDEFHYILECEFFKVERYRLVKKYFYTHPNVVKFSQLMNTTNKFIIRNLSALMNIIIKTFDTEYKNR